MHYVPLLKTSLIEGASLALGRRGRISERDDRSWKIRILVAEEYIPPRPMLLLICRNPLERPFYVLLERSTETLSSEENMMRAVRPRQSAL